MAKYRMSQGRMVPVSQEQSKEEQAVRAEQVARMVAAFTVAQVASS